MTEIDAAHPALDEPKEADSENYEAASAAKTDATTTAFFFEATPSASPSVVLRVHIR